MQLILAMSRKAKVYFLDEPIGGVDPAARDFILNTIITNYSEDATVVLSTHLISDIERVLDEVLFLDRGHLLFHRSVDEIRETEGKSEISCFGRCSDVRKINEIRMESNEADLSVDLSGGIGICGTQRIINARKFFTRGRRRCFQ